MKTKILNWAWAFFPLFAGAETKIPRGGEGHPRNPILRFQNELPAPTWLENHRKFSVDKLSANLRWPEENRPGSDPGSVVAAPYHGAQNYVYHWIRDAALVMNVVIDLYVAEVDPVVKTFYRNEIENYVKFSKVNQETFTPSESEGLQSPGYGEPKFELNGPAYAGPWGRPQNDGPALRAITLIRWLRILQNEAKAALEITTDAAAREMITNNFRKNQKFLYYVPNDTAQERAEALQNPGVIKRDLGFLVKVKTDLAIDLWEEEIGYHFYTRIAQRRALIEGAKLADDLGDDSLLKFKIYPEGRDPHTVERRSAEGYRISAEELGRWLGGFWDDRRKYILVTKDIPERRLYWKTADLDSAVILGVLHSEGSDGFYSPSKDQVLATMYALEQRFVQEYEINTNPDLQLSERLPGQTEEDRRPLSPAIGRYPEDHYDGYNGNNDTLGNPWVLTTNAFAEAHLKAARDFIKAGSLSINPVNHDFFSKLLNRSDLKANQTFVAGAPDQQFERIVASMIKKADGYFERNLRHFESWSPNRENPGLAKGSYKEQMNRRSGFQQGAYDLTWSYASFLTAIAARNAIN